MKKIFPVIIFLFISFYAAATPAGIAGFCMTADMGYGAVYNAVNTKTTGGKMYIGLGCMYKMGEFCAGLQGEVGLYQSGGITSGFPLTYSYSTTAMPVMAVLQYRLILPENSSMTVCIKGGPAYIRATRSFDTIIGMLYPQANFDGPGMQYGADLKYEKLVTPEFGFTAGAGYDYLESQDVRCYQPGYMSYTGEKLKYRDQHLTFKIGFAYYL